MRLELEFGVVIELGLGFEVASWAWLGLKGRCDENDC